MTLSRLGCHRYKGLLGTAAMLLATAIFIQPAPSATAGIATVPAVPPGSPGDTTADNVLGQLNFVHAVANFRDARGIRTEIFGSPVPPSADVAIDKSVSPNRVLIVDPGNNRVLGWNDVAAFLTHSPANIVFGQPNFNSGDCNQNTNANALPSAGTLCNPGGVAVDSSGNVYVADSGNNRVLVYLAPFTTDRIADDVIGQAGSFSAKDCNSIAATPTAATLCNPIGLAIDGSNNLFLADQDNNRMLEYNTPRSISAVPGSGDTTADRVFGQNNNFGVKSCNNGGISAKSLCAPRGVAVGGGGNVYVADRNNNRVLIYLTPLTSDTIADKVLGQANIFTTGACNKPGGIASIVISAKSLCGPLDVFIDAGGNAYVADGDNNRVLEYKSPILSDTTADKVFGQADNFTLATCNLSGISSHSLCKPSGVAVDPSGNLFVADGQNNRVLKYNTPLSSDTNGDGVLGQTLLTVNTANQVDRFGINEGGGIAIDGSGHVYVVDFGNNRVLAWNDTSAFITHAGANLVIGQPNFFTSDPNHGGVSANTLNGPTDVVVDKAGNVYVADFGNSRVLEYNTPFASGTTADKVFGQGDSFVLNDCNFGSDTPVGNSMCGPFGLALDSAGSLYVSDNGNNRVLVFSLPLTTDSIPEKVIGQSDFGSGFCNGGLATPSAHTLCSPRGVALDASNNLFVSDEGDNRVLEYKPPVAASNASASKVFGQAGSVTNTCNAGGISATSLCIPYHMAVDSAGNVYVDDLGNHRVLKYNKPLSTDVKADRVFGQNNLFNTGHVGIACPWKPSPTTLCAPKGITFDSSGNVYIQDGGDNRVLRFLVP